MNRHTASALIFLILLAGCERDDTARDAPPAIANAGAAAANVAGGKEKTSVMRPDVVAETEKAEAPAPPPPPPRRAIVHFGEDGELSSEARAAIDTLLSREVLAGAERIVIRGHSDSRGSDAANLRASRSRAETVRDYLLARGIAAERMEVVALGETRPVAPNARPDGSDYPEGRAQNRRVEVEIVAATAQGEGQAPAPGSIPADQPSS